MSCNDPVLKKAWNVLIIWKKLFLHLTLIKLIAFFSCDSLDTIKKTKLGGTRGPRKVTKPHKKRLD